MMDERVKDMRKNLTELIDEIKAHSDRLTDWKVLPVLEVNVFLAKVNKLYEKTVVLKTYLDSEYALGKFDAQKVHDDLNKVEELIEQAEAAQQENVQEVTQEVLEESDSQPIAEVAPEPVPKSVATPTPPSADESLVDKYQEDDNSLVDKLGRQPISKLIDAIGINEKYLFSNELFNEDMAGFLSFVGKVDELNNGLEAIDLFNEYRNKYGWDAQQQTTIDLLKLVERRFLQE